MAGLTGSDIAYIARCFGFTDSAGTVEEALNDLSSEDKSNTVFELVYVAVDDNGVMDNYNDYFYDFAANEYETIHSNSCYKPCY